MLDGVQPLAAKEIELGRNPSARMGFIQVEELGLFRSLIFCCCMPISLDHPVYEALQEAETLWKLRHRNIVGLTAVSISPEGQGYLLMVSQSVRGWCHSAALVRSWS
jgi:hypothetical protein